MNFQAVRQANGNKATMSAIATSIDGVSYTQQKGTPKQSCKFTDSDGEQQSVSIYQGTGQPIPPEKQGQTLSINISAKTSQAGGKLYYGGFWNANAQVQPIKVQPQQQGRQGGQQPAQRPTVPPRDYDAENRGKCRNTLIGAAIQAGQITLNPNNQISDLNYWVEYIMTGNAPLPSAQNRQPDEYDNIPEY